MTVFEERRADRAFLDEFCRVSGFVGDFDFIPRDWNKEIAPKLEKFLKTKNINNSPDYYKYKTPLRFIVKAFADERSWNEYWHIDSKRSDIIEMSSYLRNSMYDGRGSKIVKRMLNSINTIDSKIMRIILEVEDIVISSEKYYGEFLRRNMERRDEEIVKLYRLSKQFPEKLEVYNVNNSMVVCNVKVAGFNEQFCWSLGENEKIDIPQTDSFELSVRIYRKQKIFRMEEIIERLLENGKKL